jgi:hypothetical protein
MNKNGIMVLSSILLISPLSAIAEDWSYEIEPYMMASSITGDAAVGRVAGVAVDVGFDDILDNLDMAGMLHFEAHHKSGWGISLDYGFMDLGADISTSNGAVVDIGVHQGVFEALAINRHQVSGGTLDYSFGIRWWDNDLDLLIDPAVLPGSLDASVKADWVDFVVGARYSHKLNNHWNFVIQGDIGTGGADFTSSFAIGGNYKMNDKWTLDLRYKSTWVDYKDGSVGTPEHFAYDANTKGPIVGFSYKF